MHLDVLDLRAFYYRTRLGRSAQRVLQEALRSLWPETRDLTVVGYGFAAPMLRPFLTDARRVLSLMPSGQGVMAWPIGAPNLSVLVEETHWPIEAGSVDRLIIIHGLETSDKPGSLMPESGVYSHREDALPSSCQTAPVSGHGVTSPRSATAAPTVLASWRA